MTQTDHLHEVKKYHVTRASALSTSKTLINNLITAVNNSYTAIETSGDGVDVVATIDIAVVDK